MLKVREMAKKDMTGPFLALLGSLVYLYVVYNWAASPGFGVVGWAATLGSFWLPIFAGLGAAFTISLLLVALGGLAGMRDDKSNQWAMKSVFYGAVALFGLTVGGPWFWWVALGLVLGQFGVGRMMM